MLTAVDPIELAYVNKKKPHERPILESEGGWELAMEGGRMQRALAPTRFLEGIQLNDYKISLYVHIGYINFEVSPQF